MPDLQFNEDRQYQEPARSRAGESLFTRLVLATSIVSTDRQAEYVLLGFAIVAIIVSLFLLSRGGLPPKDPSPAVLEQVKQMPINR